MSKNGIAGFGSNLKNVSARKFRFSADSGKVTFPPKPIRHRLLSAETFFSAALFHRNSKLDAQTTTNVDDKQHKKCPGADPTSSSKLVNSSVACIILTAAGSTAGITAVSTAKLLNFKIHYKVEQN